MSSERAAVMTSSEQMTSSDQGRALVDVFENLSEDQASMADDLAATKEALLKLQTLVSSG